MTRLINHSRRDAHGLLCRIWCAAVLTVIATGGVGCSGDGPADASGGRAAIDDDRTNLAVGQSRFYPLTIGNRWRYESTVTFTTIIDGQPVEPSETLRFQHSVEQVCGESLDGRAYLVEEETTGRDGVELRKDWLRYRQDESGLFLADVASTTPPACDGLRESRSVPHRVRAGVAAGTTGKVGPAAARGRLLKRAESLLALSRGHVTDGIDASGDEILRLRYPLYPGQVWLVRSEPGFVIEARVEGVDVLDLPTGRTPAFRVRVGLPGEPDSEVLLWYSRCGFLRMSASGESPILDEDGDVIGLMTVDVLQEVDSIELEDVRACSIVRE